MVISDIVYCSASPLATAPELTHKKLHCYQPKGIEWVTAASQHNPYEEPITLAHEAGH